MSKRFIAPVLGVSTLALVSACVTQPEPNPRIVAAEDALARAQADEEIIRLGRASLEKAQTALNQAKMAYRSGDEARFTHEIRMTEGYVELAGVRGDQGKTEEQIDALKQERANIRVSSSEREAAQARARANLAEARAKRAAEALADYKQRRTEEGLTLVLQDLQFALDSAVLRPGAQARLRPLITYLTDENDTRIRIEGHTDSSGNDSYNRDLSRRRAQAVADYLVSAGIAQDRIVVIGRGEDQPIASNDTQSGREENRRVEITIL